MATYHLSPKTSTVNHGAPGGNTWYELLPDEVAITHCVHRVLNLPDILLNTIGDLQEMPKVLKAADNFVQRPSEETMRQTVEWMEMDFLFG